MKEAQSRLRPARIQKSCFKTSKKYGWSQKDWPDLPYHFLIDLRGNIYEGRDAMKVGDTNTSYDPAGKLLVTIMGNTNIQAPTRPQLNAMVNLMAWAADYRGLQISHGHM